MSEELTFRQKFLSLSGFFKLIGSIIIINGIGVVLIGVYALGVTWYKIATIGLNTEEHVASFIFKSIDLMLVGIVFLIFGVSIRSLVKKTSIGKKLTSVKDIFDIEGFLHQKHFLWQTLATTLVFIFITKVFKDGSLDWTDLIVPISIALITVSMFFIKKSH